MAELDDLLAENDAEPDLDDEGGGPSDTDDPFSMHAETFLDDSLPMADRVDALRQAIMAASAAPDDAEEY